LQNPNSHSAFSRQPRLEEKSLKVSSITIAITECERTSLSSIGGFSSTSVDRIVIARIELGFRLERRLRLQKVAAADSSIVARADYFVRPRNFFGG
jgi:hypothetical protein